ncbi:MAG: hypothetical protein GKR93_07280 [Gammaproteobacteria bacterium]|nr:hypothetical protein [Gammaproteobacteria bacterium]
MKNHTSALSRRSFIGASGTLAALSGMTTLANSAPATSSPFSKTVNASVSFITDALRKIGQDPKKLVMNTDIQALVYTGKTVIGPAVTCKWELAHEKGRSADIRRFVFRPLDNALPGSFWVIASGTDEILSMFGDVIARACLRNGLVGAITDSGCRDIQSIQEMGFPVFAKGAVPYGPGNIIRPVAANVPVVCAGVEVNPGDLLAADKDGIIVIPKALIHELDKSLQARTKHEMEMREKIDAGESLEKAYAL